MTEFNRVPVEELTPRALDTTVHFSWDDNPREDYGEGEGTTWSYWESVKCESCARATTGSGECTNEECDKYQDHTDNDGPVISAYYPFEESYDFDPDEEARKIQDMPLCIVQVGEQYGLCLTGGGMDLSWEIVEAFTRLGMLPPVHMVDLPSIAGHRWDDDTSYLVAACRRAVQFKMDQLKRDMDKLEHTEKVLRGTD